MTLEELMQQYDFVRVEMQFKGNVPQHLRDQRWSNEEDGLVVIERTSHYEVEIEVDWTAHSLYPKTLEALQTILDSLEPLN